MMVWMLPSGIGLIQRHRTIYMFVCVSTRTLVHYLMHWLYEKYFIVTPMWMAIRKIYSLSDMSRSTQIISFLACRYEVGFVMA